MDIQWIFSTIKNKGVLSFSKKVDAAENNYFKQFNSLSESKRFNYFCSLAVFIFCRFIKSSTVHCTTVEVKGSKAKQSKG